MDDLFERYKAANPDDTDLYTGEAQQVVTVVSRRVDRLILNEQELAEALADQLGLPVVFLRHEEHPRFLPYVPSLLRRTKVLVGMHGAMLIAAGYLPATSLLVELFPYAVAPQDYTPYRELARILGVGYRAWANTSLRDSVEPRSMDPRRGSIAHLPLHEQAAIRQSVRVLPHLCCYDSHFLFRIFQDTRVDITEIIALITDALA